MSKEIPILYSAPMIRAKLAGIKTQTRRTSKLNTINESPSDWQYVFEDGQHMFFNIKQDDLMYIIKCPFGKPDDLLFAREMLFQNGELGLEYSADKELIDESIIPNDYGPYGGYYSFRNIPSIHMPKWAARVWDRVVKIRVERLQDITESDAIAEGINPLLASGSQLALHGRLYEHYTEHMIGIFGTGLRPVESYATLYESINGDGSWKLNPWVWVIETETLSTTGKH